MVEKRRLSSVAIIFVAVALALAACGGPAATPAPAPATSAPPAAQVAPTQPSGAPTAAAQTAPTQPPAAAGLKGKLTIGLAAESESMDPYFVYQNAGESIMKAMFDNLLERDYDGKIVPGLAESWKIVDDTTIELKLRKGVKFHNGEDFDANSVKFSIERVQNADLKSGCRNNYTSIKTVDIVDPATVKLTLSKTDAALLDQFTACLSMVPPKYVTEVGNAGFIKKPIGTGPYKFVEWVKDDHTTLEANEAYWNGSFKGKPQVKTVVFRPIPEVSTRVAELRTGNVDIIQDLPPDQVKGVTDAGLKAIAQDSPQYTFVFFVSDVPNTPLADKRVRQALNYGVDADSIIKNVLLGYAKRIASPIGPLTLGYDANVKPYPYDLNKAKALLAEAGFANGFAMTIDSSTSDRGDFVQAIAGELAKIGVKAEIRRIELAQFNDNWIKKATKEGIAARWGAMFDPASALNFWAQSKGLLSRYNNAEVDKLIAEGQGTLDLDKRAKSYAQISKVLNEDPVGLYLWNSQVLYGVGKRADGWKAHPRNYLVVSGLAPKE